jgi:hypothetical protein
LQLLLLLLLLQLVVMLLLPLLLLLLLDPARHCSPACGSRHGMGLWAAGS